MMAINESQKKASAKYIKKTYDTFLVKIRKDANITLDDIREHVYLYDKSINRFIIRAITETIERDRSKDGY